MYWTLGGHEFPDWVQLRVPLSTDDSTSSRVHTNLRVVGYGDLHPPCIPWDSSSGNESHDFRNIHEKARFDVGQQVLRVPLPTLSHGGYGEMVVRGMGRGEEEEEEKGVRGEGTLLYPSRMGLWAF
ncbi:unnamed protein product [Penicillium roqueforti FM164]|uniref:Genomic scaffold, ProqFM164S01 n=1 Tax=Penicillium roqueforti (strain FM164) TaxID=1365484 RepID=W6PWB2_PENRF|nr:unnamed protein product [Penicillium roqueforti FM164]